MSIFHLKTSSLDVIAADYVNRQMVLSDNVKVNEEDIADFLGRSNINIVEFEKQLPGGLTVKARAVVLKKLKPSDNPTAIAGRLFQNLVITTLEEVSSSSSTLTSLSSVSADSSISSQESESSSSDSTESDSTASSDSDSSDSSQSVSSKSGSSASSLSESSESSVSAATVSSSSSSSGP